MLTYVAAHDLTRDQFEKLVASWSTGGGSALEVSENLLSGRWKVFEVKGGILAVSRAGTVLTVEALHVQKFGWFMRQFRDVMDRLATDWGCNTVETFCFDERLASAMLKIRGRVKAQLIEWQVEGNGDGRQD